MMTFNYKTFLTSDNISNYHLKETITVLWSVALLQLLYVTSIPYTPKWVTAEIDKILFKFLWSDKKTHVMQEIIIADTDYGGLKMIHFESMQKAI